MIGVQDKILRLIRMTMRESKAAIITQEGTPREFEIDRGVRQGNELSTAIFNIAIEGMIRACKIEETITRKAVQAIAYADDVAIIARDMRSLNEILLTIEIEARQRGLEINQTKTKYKIVSRTNRRETTQK